MRLGARLAGFGLRRQALDCFELVLNSDPSNSQAIHFVAALSGSNPDHPSPSYVLQLFEGFAPTFDDVLLGKIAYSGPREVKGAVLSASTLLPPWDILDLGCGTGLIGVELAAHAASLVGIDLSPRMIEIARKRDLYSRLICDDLFSALRDAPAASFDLVTAADVFVYVGKLDSLMPLIHRVMRAQGLFVFTAEAADGAPTIAPGADSVGYHLSNSGRYAHTAAYLSALAARNKFEVKAMNKFWLRVESDLPVAGWLAVWSTGSYER
jgi:predicted TPR repeat methyltransferase